jgi:glucose/arabinose dehydrogenase
MKVIFSLYDNCKFKAKVLSLWNEEGKILRKVCICFFTIFFLFPVISPAEIVDITIGDFFFDPPIVTIKPGDTVRWTNQGSMIHTSTSGQNCTPDGLWNSGFLAPGASFSRVFDEPGTFPYICDIASHCEVNGMEGAIVVQLVDPIPEPIPKGSISIKLETVATGLTAPNGGTFAPNDSERLFVTDQDGILWAIDLATGEKIIFLNVSDRLVDLGIFGPGTFDERGLLGVTFHPHFAANGLFYTYTSEPISDAADFSTMPLGIVADHQTVITEWQVPDPNDPTSVADPNSARELLRIDQPQFNHNAGALNFGPDKMLYISLGDGGGADDVDGQDFLGTPIVGHGDGNGQDPSNVLGTILRIDPLGSNSINGKYGIPDDNPFIGQPGFVDEIFAYGFRNPFRFSFDMSNGDLIVGDVGQNDIEEVDIVLPGGNYGWNLKEGTFCFNPNGNDPGFVFECDPGPPGLIDPVAQYDHGEGTAIIGGFVYRGNKIPALRGNYVFGDHEGPDGVGRLFYLAKQNRLVEFQLIGQADLGLKLLGFGQDANGEIYVLGNTTGVPFEDTGVVLKLAPICTLDLNLSYNGSTLTMSFEIGTQLPASWNVWVSFLNTTIPSWSVPIPVVDPPISFPIPIPEFPSLGNIGFLTTLTTQENGIICSDWETLDTGPMTAATQIPIGSELRKLFKERLE